MVHHFDFEAGRGLEALGDVLRHVAIPVRDDEIGRIDDTGAAGEHGCGEQFDGKGAGPGVSAFRSHGSLPFLMIVPTSFGEASVSRSHVAVGGQYYL
ncbi:hypothetical protein D3C72_1779140 [compost metagenome]